jgi:preprotein translocase subunit YajC
MRGDRPAPTTPDPKVDDMHVLTAMILIAQEEANPYGTFIMFGLLIAVFYFLLIRPQQRRAKRQRELVNSVEVGDRIVTIGGIHGTVKFVDDDVLHLDVAPGTTLTFQRQAVARKEIEDDVQTDAGSE